MSRRGRLDSTIAGPRRASPLLQNHHLGADLGGLFGQLVVRTIDHRHDLTGRGVEAGEALGRNDPRRVLGRPRVRRRPRPRSLSGSAAWMTSSTRAQAFKRRFRLERQFARML